MSSFSRLLGDALGVGLAYEGGPTHSHANHELKNTTFNTVQPRFSFQYYVNFVLSESGSRYLSELGLFEYDVNNLEPLVKSITMPSFSVETEQLNEYNRPRISQTDITRTPVSFVMHDTVNGATLKLWQAYYQYYYKDGIEFTNDKDKFAQNRQVNIPSFNSAKFGYKTDKSSIDRYFFSAIEIALTHGSKENKVVLVNPRITSFEHQEMSYEKSDLVDLKFTVDYEYALYDTTYQRISAENLQRYAKGKFLDLPTLAISAFVGDAIGKVNPLLNSNNQFARNIGQFAQGAITSGTSIIVGTAIQTTGTSVLSSLGDISPKAIVNSPTPNINRRNFRPGV